MLVKCRDVCRFKIGEFGKIWWVGIDFVHGSRGEVGSGFGRDLKRNLGVSKMDQPCAFENFIEAYRSLCKDHGFYLWLTALDKIEVFAMVSDTEVKELNQFCDEQINGRS